MVRSVRRSRSSRVYPKPAELVFGHSRLTLLDLAHYWHAVSPVAMPHYAHRPLTLVHCPRGVSEAGGARPESQGCRYLQHEPIALASTVSRIPVATKNKGMREYLMVREPSDFIALTQARMIELHTLNWTDRALTMPDRLVFDLDPGPGITWGDIIDAAHLVRDILASLKLSSWVKTTGGHGLHVVAPIQPEHSGEALLAFTRHLAIVIATKQPERFTTNLRKDQRHGRILVDYLRNKPLDTSVAAFSPRARLGAPVSMPVTWRDLDSSLDPLEFTVRTVPSLVARQWSHPWADYFRSRQRLSTEVIEAVASASKPVMTFRSTSSPRTGV